MPIPSSETDARTRTWFPIGSSLTFTLTCPPCGVNLIALLIRFIRICSRRVESPTYISVSPSRSNPYSTWAMSAWARASTFTFSQNDSQANGSLARVLLPLSILDISRMSFRRARR